MVEYNDIRARIPSDNTGVFMDFIEMLRIKKGRELELQVISSDDDPRMIEGFIEESNEGVWKIERLFRRGYEEITISFNGKDDEESMEEYAELVEIARRCSAPRKLSYLFHRDN